MQQSNTYVIIFSAIMTIVIGGLLSFTSQALGPTQQKAVEYDTKKQILNAVMNLEEEADVIAIYNSRIKSLVTNSDGEIVEKDEEGETIIAEKVDVSSQYKKKDPKERLLPLFIYHKEGDPSSVQSYIVPVYGNGLWDNIWGYIALNTDVKSVKGAVFDHAAETPGLGARITSPEVQNRFQGKELFNEQGEFVSVTMLKGENNPSSMLDAHTVDGLSGATLTAKGVNSMLETYIQLYLPYFNKNVEDFESKVALLNQ